jgi:hypothetical protein
MCAVTDAALETLREKAAKKRAGKGQFRINGRVLDRRTRRGVAGLRIEVWDGDPFTNDLVGGTTTDERGAFRVQFDKSYFKDWLLDPRPDLFYRVFYQETLLRSKQPSMKDVRPGDTNVVILVNAPGAALAKPQPDRRENDFCESAITCELVYSATDENKGPVQLQRGAAEAICQALKTWLAPEEPPAENPIADLTAVYEAVKKALDPAVTIPARVNKRIKRGPKVRQRGVLGRLESEVEFPQPMYEPLAAISQDLILPGVEKVPQNTISLLKTNRRFMEAYMAGLNHGFAGEVLWRGAPAYLWSSFFRQFWDVRGFLDPAADPEPWKDIGTLTKWTPNSYLGQHDARSDSSADYAVLLVRGDLLKRYPNTLVYMVKALADGNPALEDYGIAAAEVSRLWPIFSASLPPDLTFLGFNKSVEDLCAGYGYFIILEERLGEPRFGFDIPGKDSVEAPVEDTPNWWYNLTWEHFQTLSWAGGETLEPFAENTYIDDRAPAGFGSLKPVWGGSAATVANICLQRPVRIAIHAREMLTKCLTEGGA